MNPERAIVGLATVFDAPDRNEGTIWRAHQFADFVAERPGVEMRHEHRQPMDASERLGTWRAFALVPQGSTPPGLLALGSFGYSPSAEGRLANLRESFNPWHGRRGWGLSVKAGDVSDDEDGSRMWLEEVSLTRKPAYPMARVMGIGQYALDVWEMLTGTRAPVTAALTPRTVRGRLLGIAGGRPVYDEWTE